MRTNATRKHAPNALVSTRTRTRTGPGGDAQGVERFDGQTTLPRKAQNVGGGRARGDAACSRGAHMRTCAHICASVRATCGPWPSYDAHARVTRRAQVTSPPPRDVGIYLTTSRNFLQEIRA